MKPNQLFNVPILESQKVNVGYKQDVNRNILYAKLAAIGIFFILAIPIVTKIYFKGPFVSVFLFFYWLTIILLIGGSLFVFGKHIKNKVINKKWDKEQKENKDGGAKG